VNIVNIRDIVPWMRGSSRSPSTFRGETGGAGMASPFAMLRQEVDRLFDETFRGMNLPTSGFVGWPSVEVSETEKEIRVSFEVPGVDQKDIEVLIDEGDLVVRGEKRSETEDKDRRFSERVYGRFERRIPLGQEIEQDGIRAEFHNGVLMVTMPRSEQVEQRARRIPVNAS